jgi:serine/threonine protein kinase/tetratricopeptide (TPR) repeat protein
MDMSYESQKSLFGLEPDQLDRLFSLGTGGDEDAGIEHGKIENPQPADSGELATSSDFTASIQSSIEQVGKWIGPYKLVHILGEGGMGIVYLAEQERPISRQVALKVIKPGMDSRRVLARFEAERQVLALLDHPNIARIFDAGTTELGRPYFVMEYVEGLPITEFCDREVLTIEERLGLFLQVCRAMQHAHQKGIIHRDIKPSNILVSQGQEKAIPKIIDFGIAKAIKQPLTERTFYTEQGQLFGTPEYMSPEQAQLDNNNVDIRTDVYSLGVLLYELLIGALPFDRKTFRKGGLDNVRKVICGQDPVTPSIRLSKTPVTKSTQLAQRRRTNVHALQHVLRHDLDWITLKAMDKDCARRYASVDAMAIDIHSYLNHQPVSAVPPSILYRAKKLIQRHRLAAVVACAAFILFIVLLWAVQASIRTRRERARFQAFEQDQLLLKAQDAFGNQHWKDALAGVEPLLKSRYVGRRARLLYAQILLATQGAGAAVPEFEPLLGTPDETAGQAHFLLANIYYNADPCAPGGTSEYYQRWQEHREQAEQLIANTASYYFLRAKAAYGVKETLDMLAETLKRNKQHYDALRERAQIYHSQHDYEKMVRDAARMIGTRPDNPQGYGLSALALQGLGRFDEALHDHNEAILLSPEDAQFYDARRETYMHLGRYELALNDAQRCVQLKPNDLPYRYEIFATYTALGCYEDAMREYDRFLSYPFLREHRLGGAPMYLRGFFYLFSFKRVAESLAAGRSWHGPEEPPLIAPYNLIFEIESFYLGMHDKGQRLVLKGFHPSWSPDGKKLAYSHGLLMASGVAVFDIERGRAELLTTSGRNPEWSPDGNYIAFERNRRIWPIESLANLNIRTWRPDGWRQTHAEEVWIANTATHEIRRVAEGTCPRWGYRSGRLYYTSRQNNALYTVSPAHKDVEPVRVLEGCGQGAIISPDEQYVADSAFCELRIIDLDSKDVVATWTAPPSSRDGLIVSWSPDSRELSIGSPNGSWMGLWIYDMETAEASKVLDGWWMASRWAPDKSSIALTLGVFIEIWQMDLEPGMSTAASFDSVKTTDEHLGTLTKLDNSPPTY